MSEKSACLFDFVDVSQGFWMEEKACTSSVKYINAPTHAHTTPKERGKKAYLYCNKPKSKTEGKKEKYIFGTVSETSGIIKMSEGIGKDCLWNLALLGQRCQRGYAVGGLQVPAITAEMKWKAAWGDMNEVWSRKG